MDQYPWAKVMKSHDMREFYAGSVVNSRISVHFCWQNLKIEVLLTKGTKLPLLLKFTIFIFSAM